MTLSGWMDIDGGEIPGEERGRSFTSDSFTLGKKEGESIEVYSLTTEEILGNSGVNKEIFMIDPENHVYQYPRLDGHSGFLLLVEDLMVDHPNFAQNSLAPREAGYRFR